MKSSFTISRNWQIFLGALVGVLLGFTLQKFGVQTSPSSQILYICSLIGMIFIQLLKMILIPLVFLSIVVGIANLRAHAQMGKVWKLSILYFLSTTSLTVLLGLIATNIFKPGAGLTTEMFKDLIDNSSTQSITLKHFIESFIPELFMNPFTALANNEILATIVFAVFLGIALIVRANQSQKVIDLFNEGFSLIMLIIDWIMVIMPLGIMALLAKLIATQSSELFASLGKYMILVVCLTLFHGFVVLPSILWIFTKTHPFTFFSRVKEAMITAFSTSSSSATLPVTFRCVTENLKVDKNIAGFVLPLGATINMDGTALYEAVAAMFIANLVGIDLTILQQVIVFFMAILASIGAPGIPSAGMVTMVMVLQSVGLPAEAVAILIPIDRPLDAFRTMINVEGDMVGSVIVNKWSRP